MKILRVFNRALYMGAVALLVAGIATRFSNPPTIVSAHHPVISGTVICQEDGSHLVTWTVGNSEPILSMTITSINRVVSGVGVGTFIPGGGSVTGTEVLPGNQTGSISLGIAGQWSTGYLGYASGTVDLGLVCPNPTETTPTLPTPTDATPTQPTPTDTTPTPPTPTVPTPTGEPVSSLLILDPHCVRIAGEWRMRWVVSNPNGIDVLIDRWTLDGSVQPGSLIAASGKTVITNTSLGTHTVELFWGESGYASLEWTLNACSVQHETPTPAPTDAIGGNPSEVPDLLIPVSGDSELLIPVAGADFNPGLNRVTFSGIGLLGLGLIITGIRNKRKM